MDFMRISLLLFFITSAICFPSRPLNERSTELAWEAWLLVDDQNQSHQKQDDTLLKKRIKPKHVFITPNFTPDALPACADGYKADHMGRCVKIFKLNEVAHNDFLKDKYMFQLLNGVREIEFEEEEKTTMGPFQFNIPLGEDYEDSEQEESNVAILLTPTKEEKEEEEVAVKISVKRTEVNGTDVEETSVTEETGDKEIPTSTFLPENTETTVTQEITTLNEDSYETTQTEMTDTTLIAETTTETSKQAIFFLDPLLESGHVLNGTKYTPYKRQDSSTTQKNISDSLTTFEADSTLPTVTDITDENKTVINDSSTKQTPTNFVRFPDSSTDTQIFHHSTSNFFANGQFRPMNTDHIYSHRNRDKSTSSWNSPWSTSQPKPILFRFPNRHGTARFRDDQLNLREMSDKGFYRQLPQEELSYIFGGRRRQNQNR